MSVTELSHRSKEYVKINQDAQQAIKELLQVPDNYKIIFVPGGGQGSFSAIPMNLINRTGSADYVVAGIWSAIAAQEAVKYGTVNLVFPKPEKADDIPDQKSWKLNANASYLYYSDNETIEGVEFPFIPETSGVPLVADMSSNIMTKKIDVAKYGVITAAVQKNLGTAGVCLVIIREDLLGNPIKMCPSILNLTEISKAGSILNTPPIFSIYTLGKVLQWIKQNGGVNEMENRSSRKSKLLYDTIKNSNNFYRCSVKESYRSRINVSFRIRDDEQLEERFLREAEEKQMLQLKGHRLVGGIRVSLYNAISENDVVTLTTFMKEFQTRYENAEAST